MLEFRYLNDIVELKKIKRKTIFNRLFIKRAKKRLKERQALLKKEYENGLIKKKTFEIQNKLIQSAL